MAKNKKKIPKKHLKPWMRRLKAGDYIRATFVERIEKANTRTKDGSTLTLLIAKEPKHYELSGVLIKNDWGLLLAGRQYVKLADGTHGFNLLEIIEHRPA